MSAGALQFSVSELTSYLQCPEAWYQRYVLGIRKPVPSSVAAGRAYDGALNALLAARLNGAEVDSEQAVMQGLRKIDGSDIQWSEGEDPRILKDLVAEALSLYLEQGAKRLPAAVQDRFEVEFEDAAWTFVGYIDLVTQDGWIVDNKLLSRTPTQQDADDNLQLTAYAFGYSQKYGRLPEGLALDCVVKNKTLKFVTVETRRTEKDINRFLRILGQAADMMASGIVLPRPGGWYCSPTACQYWAECHERW